MFHSRTAVNLYSEPERPAILITERWANQGRERPRCVSIANVLAEKQLDGHQCHEVLDGETIVKRWKKDLRASKFLDFVGLRRSDFAWQMISL